MGSCFSKSDNTSKGSVLSKGSAVVPYSSPQNKRATMRLFGTELCPYTLRIRIALEYKGIPVQVLWLNADDENGRSKQLLAYMLPDGKLPLLQSEDHTISGSSDEIIDYIEGKFPNPSLSYKGSREWVELIRDKFSPLILKALYNADMLSQQETANQLDALFAKLDAAIGKHGSKGPYFFGNQFSLVDVYLVPFLLLERPLSFFQGISIDPAYTHLRGYSMRMTSFASYAPIRMDLDLLHESVSKNLEQSGPPPLVAMTLLQHHSILQHLEKLVVTTEELIAVSKQPCRAVDPVKGSLLMQIKRLSANYSQLLQFMLEHAQMEERVVFPPLEKAERGLTKTANEIHARDLPLMNGIKEDFKSVIALDNGSLGRREALLTVSHRLRDLKVHTIEHLREEETELLPLMTAAGVGTKQQVTLIGNCLEIMESTHTCLFPFMLSGLEPHQIHKYLNLVHKSLQGGNKVVLSRMISALKQSEDEHPSVWAIVRERFPALACLVP
ncbi:hypothetical protein KP509_07G082100 [Ceratopteris richardii]|uniref:Uncharacterized protein n=1 Tax=Ceratopteris richardii TaxID=49495 RepID=A0A8T2UK27_CERRI|nr:hypothetical protein KP509_07G082100 [Ceratopteris richardii]KAH7433705.1 hypothetical protein KP509_07G082100 [Ceratopteris richardii]KAH7433706.1 hypothetical protein KP509_07G082100 [Ceratopteris richardii]